MLSEIKNAILITLILTVITGLLYPFAITGMTQVLFPRQANGSLITANGQVIGSSLIGQSFAKPEYFHPRPSAAGEKGYDAVASSGSNLAPTNPALEKRLVDSAAAFRKENPTHSGPIPADAITASASGLDPDISIEAQTTVPGQGGEGYPIYQTLSGRASQLRVHLHDDAGPNESYLWKVLTVGQFTAAGADPRLTASQTPAPVAGSDATLPVRNYLFRNAERWLADVGFIDTIDLKSGTATVTDPNRSAIGLVGVGKYVTPELYVKYSRNFSGAAEQAQSLSAEYRVTRHLLLRGEQIRPGPGTATVVGGTNQPLKEQYNLDLKVRLEY
jgi:K+-transporting ATPase ATPase C chain